MISPFSGPKKSVSSTEKKLFSLKTCSNQQGGTKEKDLLALFHACCDRSAIKTCFQNFQTYFIFKNLRLSFNHGSLPDIAISATSSSKVFKSNDLIGAKLSA
jgi:hypothetical protein